ncbi:MAG: hypothetical protein SCH68_11745 [Brevefilum sp.]|nr:hypothetical protein [Brevefilum sp.]
MMVYLIIIAQWLGAEQYAYIAAAHAATALSAFLFSWGFNEWLMKTGAINFDVEALGGSVIKLKVLLGVVWAVGLWAVLRLIRPELYLSSVIILTIVEVWFDSTFGTLLALLILKSRAQRASVLLALSRLFRLLTVIFLMVLGARSVVWVLLVRLITTLIFFVLAWIYAKPKLLGEHIIKPKVLFRTSSAFNIGELLNLIFLHADVNILSWLGADLTVIANYSIVISLINAIITLPSGIFNVILPNMVRAYQNLKSHFYRYIRWLYVGFIILGIALWIGAAYLSMPIITSFFGETYLTSIQLMIWLSPLLAVRTINQANIAYLVAVGCQTRRLLPQLIAVIAKIVGGLIAVTELQTLGIIIVTLGTEGMLYCGYVIQIVRHYLNPQKMECYEHLNDHF